MAAEETRVAGTAEFESADKSLRKTMGFNQLLFLSVTALVGSGWLFAAILSAGVAGPAAILSWAIGGVLIIFVAFSYMEPAGMLPRSGAIVRYPQLTHGAYTGWMLGWAYWLSAITVPAIEAEAVVLYVGGRFPNSGILETVQGVPEMRFPQGILFGVGLMLLFFALNFFGIRLLSEVTRWLTWWKLLVPAATAIFLFTITKAANFSSFSFHGHSGFAPYGTASIFGAISTTGILFSYLGFRQALDYAGEAKNPQKHVPLATVLSVFIAFAIYVTIQIAFTGAINWHSAGVHPGDWLGLSTSSWASAPLFSAFQAAGIGWLATFSQLLVVDAGISPSATGWVYMGTSARTNYGLSVNGNLPKSFQKPNRWQIPWVSLIIAAVIGCLFFIPAPSWYKLVGFISSATALTYIMGGVGTMVLRRHAGGLYRPFRLPGVWIMAPLGFLAAWMVVYWSGYAILIQVMAAVFLGLPIFVWNYARKRAWFATPARNWLAQLVSLVYLGTWIYLQYLGGWLLRVTVPAPHSLGFWAYFISMVADVLFFSGALWLLSNPQGRKHVNHGMWFVVTTWALIPISYYGAYGPEANPAMHFPWDTLAALGVGIVGFFLALLSGFNTDELKEIVAASNVAPPAVSSLVATDKAT
jgi:amino acid transporter